MAHVLRSLEHLAQRDEVLERDVDLPEDPGRERFPEPAPCGRLHPVGELTRR